MDQAIWTRIVIAISLVVVFANYSQQALAQNGSVTTQSHMPAIKLPSDLKAYADYDDVIASAASVLDILATAKFEIPSHIRVKDKQSNCDAINWGMNLAYAGYNMFVNLRERELLTPNSVLGGWSTINRKGLVGKRRGLLTRIWDTNNIERLLSLRGKLKKWPPLLRNYLATFLTELRRFKRLRREMWLRAPKSLKDIQRRQTTLYFYQYHHYRDIKNIPYGDKAKEAEFHKEWPTMLTYETHSSALYKLMKESGARNISTHDGCLEQTPGTKIVFGDTDVPPYDNGFSYPMKYMFTFWGRRDAEGTAELADFVIAQVISALK